MLEPKHSNKQKHRPYIEILYLNKAVMKMKPE
jgi:hypothetical protein